MLVERLTQMPLHTNFRGLGLSNISMLFLKDISNLPLVIAIVYNPSPVFLAVVVHTSSLIDDEYLEALSLYSYSIVLGHLLICFTP